MYSPSYPQSYPQFSRIKTSSWITGKIFFRGTKICRCNKSGIAVFCTFMLN